MVLFKRMMVRAKAYLRGSALAFCTERRGCCSRHRPPQGLAAHNHPPCPHAVHHLRLALTLPPRLRQSMTDRSTLRNSVASARWGA